MKTLFILLFVISFSVFGAEITHDYVLSNAISICKNHKGFHYIVTDTKWDKNDNQDSHPCTRKYVISCGDEYKQSFTSETKYCFISKMQIDESLEKLK